MFGIADFWKLSASTVCMLDFGCTGENGAINPGTDFWKLSGSLVCMFAVGYAGKNEAINPEADPWKLLAGTVCMLAFGHYGETEAINPGAAYTLCWCSRAYIPYEISAGESVMASGAHDVSVQLGNAAP